MLKSFSYIGATLHDYYYQSGKPTRPIPAVITASAVADVSHTACHIYYAFYRYVASMNAGISRHSPRTGIAPCRHQYQASRDASRSLQAQLELSLRR